MYPTIIAIIYIISATCHPAEREREKTPDIDKFIRNACGEAPIPSFNGDTILPRIAKKTSRKPLNPQGEKDEATTRHGKKDRSSRGGKKERREKKKKAAASTSAVRAPSPPPSASPDLVQMYKVWEMCHENGANFYHKTQVHVATLQKPE